MDNELRDLYQELILDHSKNPRNFHLLKDASHCGEGFNPLCGDHIHIYLTLEDEVIKEICFQGTGCAICKASASLMSSALKGKEIQDVDELYIKFHNLVTGNKELSDEDYEELGKLAVFAGVSEFPVRVKCATLAWHTMNSALKGELVKSTTE